MFLEGVNEYRDLSPAELASITHRCGPLAMNSADLIELADPASVRRAFRLGEIRSVELLPASSRAERGAWLVVLTIVLAGGAAGGWLGRASMPLLQIAGLSAPLSWVAWFLAGSGFLTLMCACDDLTHARHHVLRVTTTRGRFILRVHISAAPREALEAFVQTLRSRIGV